MAEETFPAVDVALPMILDDEKQKFLWTWNRQWRVFSLPSSRVRRTPGLPATTASAARQAAERAAAEALGVPVVVRPARRLKPILVHSGRNGQLKSYSFEIFSASAHEQFAHQLRPAEGAIWLAGHEALSGEFGPLSTTSLKVIEQLAEVGLIPGRHQLASTIVLTRGPDDNPEFLMRSNSEWGYFFPSRRRTNAEDPLKAAGEATEGELGLKPGTTISLSPASGGPITFHDKSERSDVPTYYVHSVYSARLHDGARLSSSESLVWVPVADVVAGATDGTHTVGQSAAPRPGKVSRTARRILEVLGYF